MSRLHREIGEVVLVKGEADIHATIVGVLLRESGTEYEVAWFTNGARQTAWVWSCEIAAASPVRGQVGFCPSPTPPTPGQVSLLKSMAAEIRP